ncbi:Hypothetical_protein [Hexamita inflata]|uniref:Hypothetical_protein n=1 Tax=Hexamita inflata TaxID=28002 RepID=A0AA86NJ11_9EUKA|nr:Hypothetical protein HINF_LOCUS8577 [Hexamita inflata]
MSHNQPDLLSLIDPLIFFGKSAEGLQVNRGGGLHSRQCSITFREISKNLTQRDISLLIETFSFISQIVFSIHTNQLRNRKTVLHNLELRHPPPFTYRHPKCSDTDTFDFFIVKVSLTELQKGLQVNLTLCKSLLYLLIF